MSTTIVTAVPDYDSNNGNGQSIPDLAKKDASVWELALIIAGSRDFPSARTPEKAAVRILAGREMGVGPVASVIGIRVEQGRVSMDATLMAGCIKRSDRYDYRVVQHTEAETALEFSDKGLVVGESRFTWDDAVKAGLNKKDTWKAYPRNMMFARALSNGARWYCPGIFGGSIYTHEEIGLPTDSDGQIMDGDGGHGMGVGADLCIKDQRAEIRGLLAQIGTSEADYCAGQGIKMLDEFSEREAKAAIKGLAKQAAKKAAAGEKANSIPAEKPTETSTGSPAAAVSPAQPLVEAQAESQQPSTPQQHQRIFDLAEALVGKDESYDLLVAMLESRGVDRYSKLNHLQAAALIQKWEERLASEGRPFPAA